MDDKPRFLNLRDGGNLTDDDLAASIRALRCLRNACLIAFIALIVVLIANKALPQAAYDALNYEVIR